MPSPQQKSRHQRLARLSYNRVHFGVRKAKALAGPKQAHPVLLAAAKYHGMPAGACPNCGAPLVELFWVYGWPGAKTASGQTGMVRSLGQIENFVADAANAGQEITVHCVEVCRACEWNFVQYTCQVPAGTRPAAAPPPASVAPADMKIAATPVPYAPDFDSLF